MFFHWIFKVHLTIRKVTIRKSRLLHDVFACELCSQKRHSLFPFSLILNRTDDFGVPFARLRRSAVQPSLQCSATAPAVHCIRPRSALYPPHTCNLSRKYLQPFPQVLATIPARTCARPCPYLREKTPLFRISSPSPTISLPCLLAYCRAGSRELRVGIICHADGCQEG